MFANQRCCQCDCFFNVRIDGRFIPNCSQLSGQKTAHVRTGKPSFELNIRLFNFKHNAIYFVNFRLLTCKRVGPLLLEAFLRADTDVATNGCRRAALLLRTLICRAARIEEQCKDRKC